MCMGLAGTAQALWENPSEVAPGDMGNTWGHVAWHCIYIYFYCNAAKLALRICHNLSVLTPKRSLAQVKLKMFIYSLNSFYMEICARMYVSILHLWPPLCFPVHNLHSWPKFSSPGSVCIHRLCTQTDNRQFWSLLQWEEKTFPSEHWSEVFILTLFSFICI